MTPSRSTIGQLSLIAEKFGLIERNQALDVDIASSGGAGRCSRPSLQA